VQDDLRLLGQLFDGQRKHPARVCCPNQDQRKYNGDRCGLHVRCREFSASERTQQETLREGIVPSAFQIVARELCCRWRARAVPFFDR
jgi:hypothetical protein